MSALPTWLEKPTLVDVKLFHRRNESLRDGRIADLKSGISESAADTSQVSMRWTKSKRSKNCVRNSGIPVDSDTSRQYGHCKKRYNACVVGFDVQVPRSTKAHTEKDVTVFFFLFGRQTTSELPSPNDK